MAGFVEGTAMDETILFETKVFENFQDGVMLLRGTQCLYANPQHLQLWLGTGKLTSPGGKYASISPPIDEMISSRVFIQDTIPVNKGSSVLYFYLYCFPINGHLYVVMTRDVTETYLTHEHDKEYKSLFNVVFNAVRFPLAIVSSSGVVSRNTPSFFQCFSDEITMSSGSYIWDFFGKDRPAVKELFEELISRRNGFDFQGFKFIPVSANWVIVYSFDSGSSEPTSEDHVSDLLAFFRVVKSMKALPWRWILVCFLFLTTLIGQLDPSVFLQLIEPSPIDTPGDTK